MWYGGKGSLWLLPLSFLYGLLMGLRSLLYRMGLRHRVRMKVPVVVVGNLTVGGTGKTPLVAWLSTHRAAVGLRAAIVSRGYGGRARGVTRVTVHSRPSEVGDEPLLLARRRRRRCSSAKTAARESRGG
jgi:tetraacyldisaccharide 4'-kinase